MFSGKSQGIKHPECHQGSAGGHDWIPTSPWRPAPQSHAVQGPPGQDADPRPQQAYLYQPGTHAPLHSGEDIGPRQLTNWPSLWNVRTLLMMNELFLCVCLLCGKMQHHVVRCSIMCGTMQHHSMVVLDWWTKLHRYNYSSAVALFRVFCITWLDASQLKKQTNLYTGNYWYLSLYYSIVYRWASLWILGPISIFDKWS